MNLRTHTMVRIWLWQRNRRMNYLYAFRRLMSFRIPNFLSLSSEPSGRWSCWDSWRWRNTENAIEPFFYYSLQLVAANKRVEIVSHRMRCCELARECWNRSLINMKMNGFVCFQLKSERIRILFNIFSLHLASLFEDEASKAAINLIFFFFFY